MAMKGQRQKKYSSEFKETILKMYWEGYSSRVLAKEYSISENTIRMWSFNIKHSKVGGKRGREKTKGLTKEDYQERYEILKKYQAFLEARQGKK